MRGSSLAAGQDTQPEQVVVCVGATYDERRFSRMGDGECGQPAAAGMAEHKAGGAAGADNADEGSCGVTTDDGACGAN